MKCDVFLAGLVASALNFSMGLQGSITHLHDDVEPYRQTFSENPDLLLYVGDTEYSCTLTLVLQSAPTRVRTPGIPDPGNPGV